MNILNSYRFRKLDDRYRITLLIPSDNYALTLYFRVLTSATIDINWGDGNIEQLNSIQNNHTYALAGSYQISLYNGTISDMNPVNITGLLTSIDNFGNIFTGTEMYRTYYACTLLTGISTDPISINYLNNQVTSLDLTFRQTTLEKFPNGVTFESVTNCASGFMFMYSMTTTNDITLESVTYAYRAFRGNTLLVNIDSLIPYNLSNGTEMFYGCTIATESYSNFLIRMAANAVNSGVTFHGGSSKYNTAGQTARAYLTGTLGWSITDGGLE